jgi:leucyl-tRNA synthetase
VNPRAWTEENIVAMRGQMERIGLSFDWRRQMAAHRPEYYKFDQWFFLKMYEMGLAYKKMTQVNWCEHDQATLSNEQASGGLCWRCGNPVTEERPRAVVPQDDEIRRRAGRRFGQHRERLAGARRQAANATGSGAPKARMSISDCVSRIADLEKIRNPKSQIPNRFVFFTTRIDTIYGANAIVVAAEHPVVEEFKNQFAKDVIAKIDEIRPRNSNRPIERSRSKRTVSTPGSRLSIRLAVRSCLSGSGTT